MLMLKKKSSQKRYTFFLLWITEKVFLSLKSHIWRRKKKKKGVLDCKRNKNNKKKTFPFFSQVIKIIEAILPKKNKEVNYYHFYQKKKKINRKKMCIKNILRQFSSEFKQGTQRFHLIIYSFDSGIWGD